MIVKDILCIAVFCLFMTILGYIAVKVVDIDKEDEDEDKNQEEGEFWY